MSLYINNIIKQKSFCDATIKIISQIKGYKIINEITI